MRPFCTRLLPRRDTGDRLLFVSTHLARNPESHSQQAVRLRQVAQLMKELGRFSDRERLEDVPIVIGGDWNSESLEEIRAVTAATCRLEKVPVHPLLWAAVDVPTPPTSCTLLRKSKIDYIMYQEHLLELVSSDRTEHLPPGVCIPDETHPSDHLPIAADFAFTPRHAYARLCADRFCRSLVSNEKFDRPLIQEECYAAWAAVGRPTPDASAAAAVALGVLDPTHERLFSSLLAAHHDDGDGDLRRCAFNRAYRKSLEDGRPFHALNESIALAFSYFDIDGDGMITPDEFRSTLRAITPADFDDDLCAQILAKADYNGDGLISPDEFANALLRAACNSYELDDAPPEASLR